MSVHAVIDIGTNSILLLAGAPDRTGKINIREQRFRAPRLGEGVSKSGMMSAPAIKRALTVLGEYGDLLEKLKPDSVGVFGTDVLRRAGNAEEFRKQISERFGWNTEILSVEQEAELAYYGTIDSIPSESGCYLVLDAGGGSTEIALGDVNGIRQRFSLDLGAVRLLEEFRSDCQLCTTERITVIAYIKLRLSEIGFTEEIDKTCRFIGTGGTLSTLAALKQGMAEYDSGKINGFCFTRSELWDWFFRLNALNREERRCLPGMEPGREDVITYGLLIYIVAMELWDLDLVTASDRGVRFGYLKKMLKSNFR